MHQTAAAQNVSPVAAWRDGRGGGGNGGGPRRWTENVTKAAKQRREK